MFGNKKKTNDKKTHEAAITTMEEFFDNLESGLSKAPNLMEQFRTLGTPGKAVQLLRYLQHDMHNFIDMIFAFNEDLESYIEDFEEKGTMSIDE